MIVLDTHVWLWWVSKPSELSRAASVRIGAETRIGVSAISCLEVATAVAKGRITLERDSMTWLKQALMGAPAS
jgi:PIN domain nuclease of toxin-antitoxin system